MNCCTTPMQHDGHGVGHNRPPKPEPFGLRAAWLRFANDMELRRLAKLHIRIAMKERALKTVISERQRIMNRCTRRMERSKEKKDHLGRRQ